MKFPFLFSVVILTMSCSKNTDNANYPDNNFVKIKYDTTAIDSFAPGATPNNVKQKVLIIKDSLSEKKKELEDKIKALEKQKEAAKEKEKEKEKKKQEEKAKEQPKPTSTATTEP